MSQQGGAAWAGRQAHGRESIAEGVGGRYAGDPTPPISDEPNRPISMTPRPSRADPVLYYDRERGEVREERVFGDGSLRFFYGPPVGRVLTWAVFRRRPFNRLYGWWKRRRVQECRIAAFASALEIDLEECEKSVGGYASLDEFFCRRLREGARPIDRSPGTAVFGVEGRALVYPDLASDRVVPVKGRDFRVAHLLQAILVDVA